MIDDLRNDSDAVNWKLSDDLFSTSIDRTNNKNKLKRATDKCETEHLLTFRWLHFYCINPIVEARIRSRVNVYFEVKCKWSCPRWRPADPTKSWHLSCVCFYYKYRKLSPTLTTSRKKTETVASQCIANCWLLRFYRWRWHSAEHIHRNRRRIHRVCCISDTLNLISNSKHLLCFLF